MEKTDAFLAELRAHGAVAHLRRARGPDIDAACGQLRKRAAAGGELGERESVSLPSSKCGTK
jgi:23S rRNA (adenine2503-C2)-methyltransferase